jgi:DNA (cytosine-5)-methyltransferase 1
MYNQFNLVSFFSGAGGLDLGFKKAGFQIIWANEYDASIWQTYQHNHKNTFLDKRSITQIPAKDVPDCLGIIGGPPCQSWSEAGAGRGIHDARGQLFFDYIRLISAKRPLFFLAENVSGLLFEKHQTAFQHILSEFKKLDYNVSYYLLDAHDYNVPQERKRVIIVGYQSKMRKTFEPPKANQLKPVLRDAIADLELRGALPALDTNKTNGDKLHYPNHEYMIGGFSSMYMSRNRVRAWDEPSFTIQASGRHAPLHPKAPKMVLIAKDKRIFVPEKEHLYRRLSVRECARIQTFPDSFIFKYTKLDDAYKMIGNAVPVEFAHCLADVIYRDVSHYLQSIHSPLIARCA